MKRVLLVCFALALFAANAVAQKEKPWTEWSEKEALKMLSDSAWGQSQKELTDSASGSGGSTITSAAQNASGSNAVMTESAKANAPESGQSIGQKSMTLSLVYNISFLSAKPVRQAFIRIAELRSPDSPPERVSERRAFIDRDFGDYIVVSLILDGSDRKRLVPAKQFLGGANPATFKDVVYLERKDGKRVALMDYKAPGTDPLGAKFIFPRTLEGKPFLDANSGEVRVFIEIGKTKLNRRFKVADMMYDGKLEY